LKKITYCLILISSLSSQSLSSLNYSGFGLDVGERGSGIFFNRTWSKSEELCFISEIRIFDVKHPDEIIIQDYNTGRGYKFNDINLMLLPLLLGAKYYPFVGKIANNFAPFVSAKAGPILALDGAESGTFKEKWITNLDYYFTLGGYFGVGADLLASNSTILSIRVGYDILPMKGKIDGSDQYNGALVRFGFNWKK
jgi:hypothetical protein